jgi:hypothetical protein
MFSLYKLAQIIIVVMYMQKRSLRRDDVQHDASATAETSDSWDQFELDTRESPNPRTPSTLTRILCGKYDLLLVYAHFLRARRRASSTRAFWLFFEQAPGPSVSDRAPDGSSVSHAVHVCMVRHGNPTVCINLVNSAKSGLRDRAAGRLNKQLPQL